MPVINKSISIDAPVSDVFKFVTSPDNWTRYVTSLVDVRNVSAGAPKKGSTFKWTYKMMGFRFIGDGEITAFTRNKAFGLVLKSRVTINESYEFIPEKDGVTELKIRVEYDMPGQVLEAISNNKLVQRLNAMESKNVLDKIKLMCETGV